MDILPSNDSIVKFMKKFNFSKGLIVGLLTFVLAIATFGAVKASAAVSGTPEITVNITVTDKAHGNHVSEYVFHQEADPDATRETVITPLRMANNATIKGGTAKLGQTKEYYSNIQSENFTTINGYPAADFVTEDAEAYSYAKAYTQITVRKRTDVDAESLTPLVFNIGFESNNAEYGTAFADTVSGTAKTVFTVKINNIDYTYTVNKNDKATGDVKVTLEDLMKNAKKSDNKTTIEAAYPDGIQIATVKKGNAAIADDDTAIAYDSETKEFTIKKQTGVLSLADVAINVTAKPAKVGLKFKVEAGDKTYSSTVKIDNKDGKKEIKPEDILAAVVDAQSKAVKVADKVIVGYAGHPVNSADAVITYVLADTVDADIDLTSNDNYKIVLADAVTAVNYDAASDSLVFTSPVPGVKIYWANVKKDAGASLKGNAFKVLTTTLASKNPFYAKASLPLNDKSAGLKVAENKATYLYYSSVAPADAKTAYTPNLTIDGTLYKKLTINVNYAIADPNNEALAIGSIVTVDNDKNTATLASGTDAFNAIIDRLQYSKDGKTWYYAKALQGNDGRTRVNPNDPVAFAVDENTITGVASIELPDFDLGLVDKIDGEFKWNSTASKYQLDNAVRFYKITDTNSLGIEIDDEVVEDIFGELAVGDTTYTYVEGWFATNSSWELQEFVPTTNVFTVTGTPEAGEDKITITVADGNATATSSNEDLTVEVKEAPENTKYYKYFKGWYTGRTDSALGTPADDVTEFADDDVIVFKKTPLDKNSFKVTVSTKQTAEDFGITVEADDDEETSLGGSFVVNTVYDDHAFDGAYLYSYTSKAKSDKLQFRLLGTAATVSPKANATRDTKAVKVSIKNSKKPGKVKLDVTKEAINVKNGFDFAVTESKDVLPGLNDWTTILPFNKNASADASATNPYVATATYVPYKKLDDTNGSSFTGIKVSSLPISKVIPSIGTATEGTWYVWIRKSATSAAPAQQPTAVEITFKSVAPSLKKIEEGDCATLKINAPADLAQVNYYALADEKNGLKIPTISKDENDTNTAAFEYLIIDAADYDASLSKIDFTSAKWTKVAAGTVITVDKAKSKYKLATAASTDKATDHTLVDGSYILIRRAGKKGEVLASKILVTKVATKSITGSEEGATANDVLCLVSP